MKKIFKLVSLVSVVTAVWKLLTPDRREQLRARTATARQRLTEPGDHEK